MHYFSFEIFFRDELMNNILLQKIKTKEIKYSSKLSAIVVQDEYRKGMLYEENCLNNQELIDYYLIPVAPSRNKFKAEGAKTYRAKLGIDSEAKVLVHSGSVEKWSGMEIVIEALKKGIPKNYTILIHSKFPLDLNNDLHKELIDLSKNGYPVIVHDNQFADYSDYCAFLSSFDFGLALYVKDSTSYYTGKNITEIGLASGKFSTYMLMDMPTIATTCFSYQNLNSDYCFGSLINDADGLINVLNSNTLPAIPKGNCKKIYDLLLDPAITMDAYINSLIS
jgi:hypothetical protein